jgi:hypothetical protein
MGTGMMNTMISVAMLNAALESKKAVSFMHVPLTDLSQPLLIGLHIKIDRQVVWPTSAYGKLSSRQSTAPATLVAVQKNATTVGVFYFYYYSGKRSKGPHFVARSDDTTVLITTHLVPKHRAYHMVHEPRRANFLGP